MKDNTGSEILYIRACGDDGYDYDDDGSRYILFSGFRSFMKVSI